MSEVLKTACEWRRSLRWRMCSANASSIAEYKPGRISVIYYTTEDGLIRIKCVLQFSDAKDPRKRKLTAVYTIIPLRLKIAAVLIIRENEPGLSGCAIRFPDGEVFHA